MANHNALAPEIETQSGGADGSGLAGSALPHHDPLTGLFSHSHFHDALESRFAHSQTHQLPLACILLDIDYFRELNEALGHRFGDEVLRQTAAELMPQLRQQDVASRYGGDKFGIILPETSMSQAVALADTLRIALSSQDYCDQRNSTHITLSAGVAGADKTTRSKNEFLQHAEAALAEAKQKGRNRVCYWQSPVRQPRSASLRTAGCGAAPAPRDQHEQSAIEEIRERFADLQKDFKKHYLNSSMPMIEEMEAADGFLSAHSQNVARLSTRMARRLQLEQNEVDSINTAALLHDIGKLAIDGGILRKRTPLSAAEFDLIKKHPLYGVSLLSHTRIFDEELPLILHHHERFDGDGYPHGLKGENIPLGSRIICIAEAFDGLTAGAVYRAAVSAENALAELSRCAGSHFDPALVTIMISLARRSENQNNQPEA